MSSETKNSLSSSFFTCLVIGALVTIIVTVIGLNNIWQTGSAVLVLVYATIVWKTEDRTEENIDSIYYLGFIFTIVSLLVSLIPLSAEGADLSAHSVLGAFSVALSTTLVGITAKIIIGQHQFDDSSTDVEEQIRSFSHAVHSVTAALNVVAEDVKEQNRKIVDMYSSHSEQLLNDFEDLQETLSESIKDQSKQLLDDHQKYTESLRQASEIAIEKTRETVEPGIKELDKQNKTLSISIASLESRITALSKSFETQQNHLSANLTNTMNKNEQIIESQLKLAENGIEKTLLISGSVEQLKSDLASASNEIKSLQFNIDSVKLNDQVDILARKISDINNIAIKDVSKQISEPLELLANATNQRISELINGIDKNSERLLTRADEAEAINVKLSEVINDSSKKIIESLKAS